MTVLIKSVECLYLSMQEEHKFLDHKFHPRCHLHSLKLDIDFGITIVSVNISIHYTQFITL